MTSIKLGDTEIIGNYAFYGCVALESVISKYQKKEPLLSGSFLYSQIKIFIVRKFL